LKDLEAKKFGMQQKSICSRIKQGPMNLGESFLDFRAPPTLFTGVTFKKTLSPS